MISPFVCEPSSYEDFEEHPLYGREPRRTVAKVPRGFHGHWRIAFDERLKCCSYVRGTWVRADRDKQNFSCVFVTHYVDELRICQSCGVKFIFFAEEQKYWYEELGFPLDANAVECVVCRKKGQGVARLRAEFEAIRCLPIKTTEQTLELAELTIAMINSGNCGLGAANNARAGLNRLPMEDQSAPRCMHLREELKAALQMRDSTKISHDETVRNSAVPE